MSAIGTQGGLSGLGIRALASVVLAPAVLAAVWAGGWFFAAMTIAGATIIYHEWRGMALAASNSFETLAVGLLMVALGYFAQADVKHALFILAGLLVIGLPAALVWNKRWRFAGIIYAGAPLVALVALRTDPEYGLAALFWLFAMVWGTDIFAYFTGRLVGGPKIWPRISPKKTWAGLIGGVCAAAIAGAGAAHVMGTTSPVVLALVSAALAIVAQAGDFLESAVKRHFHVKDSGTLIPGHGGLMDRVDGLVAAAVVAFALGSARAGFDHAAAGILIW